MICGKMNADGINTTQLVIWLWASGECNHFLYCMSLSSMSSVRSFTLKFLSWNWIPKQNNSAVKIARASYLLRGYCYESIAGHMTNKQIKEKDKQCQRDTRNANEMEFLIKIYFYFFDENSLNFFYYFTFGTPDVATCIHKYIQKTNAQLINFCEIVEPRTQVLALAHVYSFLSDCIFYIFIRFENSVENCN